MKDTIYLICGQDGVRRLRKSGGNVARGEIAIKASVAVDDALFKQPVMLAELTATEKSVVQGKAELRTGGLSSAEIRQAEEALDERELDELVRRGKLKREYDKDRGVIYVKTVVEEAP